MSEASTLILATLAGAVLGMIFFCGLLWTIRRGLSSKRPALLFLGSLLLRTLIVVAGFYFISRGDWRSLLACLLGFLVARLIVMRHVGTPVDKGSRIIERGGM
jgi:F1F0 ATPase subunit 2